MGVPRGCTTKAYTWEHRGVQKVELIEEGEVVF